MPEASATDPQDDRAIILIDLIRQAQMHSRHGATEAVEVRLRLAEKILATGLMP